MSRQGDQGGGRESGHYADNATRRGQAGDHAGDGEDARRSTERALEHGSPVPNRSGELPQSFEKARQRRIDDDGDQFVLHSSGEEDADEIEWDPQ